MLGRGTRLGRQGTRTRIALHGLRLLRRHADRVLPRRHRRSPPSRPRATARASARSSRRSGSNEDRDYNIKRLVKRLQRIDKEMSGEARDLFARFIADGDVGRVRRGSADARCAESFAATMQTLRDQDFQRPPRRLPARPADVHRRARRHRHGRLGVAHPRRRRQASTSRTTTSTAFAEFVRDNPAAIEALAILLSRPKDWSPDALLALRDALQARAAALHRGRTCERAFRARYHKALVDIISMVKHAAADTAPLLTAEERVDAAVAKVVDGRELTDDAVRVAGSDPAAPGREPLDRPRRLRR